MINFKFVQNYTGCVGYGNSLYCSLRKLGKYDRLDACRYRYRFNINDVRNLKTEILFLENFLAN